MAKRKTKLTIRIPPYQTPRNAWRKKIHRIALLEAERTEISYRPSDKLELQVRLYLKEGPLFSHDLDKKKKALEEAAGSHLHMSRFFEESSIKKLALPRERRLELAQPF